MTATGHVSHDELREALQSALGQERADAAIRNAAAALSLMGDTFTHDEGLEILGKVAEHDGIVGISARFARSRLMTRWATARLDAVRSSSD